MVESIIKSFEVWTDAQGLKSNGRVKSIKNISLEGIARLRELILDSALRGKLVAQDPKGEPASELIKKIAAEKLRLIKEGKIKKEQSLPEITEKEKPFELPESWEWVRLGTITNKIGSGSTPRGGSNVYTNSGVVFLRSQNIRNEGLQLDDVVYINDETNSKMGNTVVMPNDILLNITGGSLGRSTIFPNESIAANVSQHVTIIRPTLKASSAFLHKCVLSPYVQSMIWGRQVGANREGLSKRILELFEFPFPPLAEQTRIVAKVDSLMALCEKLEAAQTASLKTHQLLVTAMLQTLTAAKDADELHAAWGRLSTHFDTLFCTEDSIDQLKQTVLQLAVMGRLVKQYPSDEPAGELMKRIAKEKDKLVKEGKLRKQTPLPKIKREEIPSNLPKGWEVSRLGDFTFVGTGSTPSRDKAAYYYPSEISWVTSGETSQDFIYETGEKISALALKETNVSIYPKGSLIVAMYGQGKTRGQVSELMIDAGTNQACAAIVLINKDASHRKYLKYFFRKAYEEIRNRAAGGAQPNLNLGKVANTIIPIPPLAEQQRIVAKIDELFALCDALKTKMEDAGGLKVSLSKTVVKNAVG